MSNKRKNIDINLIVKLYVEDKKSSDSIKKIFLESFNLNISKSFIISNLKACGIAIRSSHERQHGVIRNRKNKFIDDNYLIKLYVEDKKTLQEISEILLKEKNIKISIPSIYNRLKKLNISIRTLSQTKKGKNIKNNIDNNYLIKLYVEDKKSAAEISEILSSNNIKFSKHSIITRLKSCNVKIRNNNECAELNKKQIDEQLIVKLYCKENKSIQQISEFLSKKGNNISPSTINRRLKKYNIECKNHLKIHHYDQNKIVELYQIDNIPIKILAAQFNCNVETIRKVLIMNNVKRSNNITSIEFMIKRLFEENNLNYVYNSRSIIKPLELDFYLPEYNIAIECNGIYFHSKYSGNKERKYHYDKYLQCKEQGITLLQFWEDDLNNKFDIIESMILSRINKSKNKLDARKCIIRKLSFSEIKSFCNENHIQGQPASNNKGIGLFFEDKLVSLISYTYKNEIIITRFCSLLNYNVRGAFSKILKYLKTLNKSIITYSSNDISNGNLYLTNGFECINETIDMYYTDYDEILNRQKFMKHKLKNKLEIFDENLTENENMILNGYDVVYKSGIKTWVFNN